MRKQLEYIALFMALLVISIPFCVSSAYAEQSNIIKKAIVYGENGIEGAVNAEDDTLYVEVQLETGEDILKDEIFYESDNGFLGTIMNIFDYCSGGVCVFSHPVYNNKNGKYLANIEVDTFDTNKQDSIIAEFCADDVAPTVTINNVKQQISSLIITYTAEDNKITNKECKQKIANAQLLINTNTVDTKVFDADNTVETGAFTIPISSIIDENYEEGDTISIVIEAEDVLGNKGSSSPFTKSIDGSGPDILEDTLKVTDDKGEEIKYVAGSTENDDYSTVITISIDIMEKTLKKVEADLRGITLEGDDKTVKAECTNEETLEGTVNHCSWKNVEFDGGAEGNIMITAEDLTGAKDKLEKTLPVTKIENGPTIDSIFIVGHEQDNPVYVKKNFEVGVRVSDQVGFNKSKELTIELTGATGATEPDECIEVVAGTQECFFRNLKSIDVKEGSIKISDDSKNDIGKEVNIEGSSMTELKFIIDNNNPVPLKFKEEQTLLGITYKNGETAILRSTSCPTYDDSLEVFVIVKDANKPNIVVDASEISASEIITGQCVETDSSEYPFIEGMTVGSSEVAKAQGLPIAYECSVDINNIIPATSKSKIPFKINITDPAGNVLELQSSTELCAYEPSAVPDCVKSIRLGDEVYPILKKTLQKTNIYIPTTLEYDLRCGNSGSIIDQDIQCEGVEFQFLVDERVSTDSEIRSGYYSVPVIMTIKRNELSSTDYYAFDSETGEDLDNSNLEIKCNVAMSIKNNQLYYQELEEEVFTINLPLEGTILGEASDSMKKVIKSLNDDIDKLGKINDAADTALTIIQSICSALEILGQINAILQGIKSILYSIYLIGTYTPPASGAARAAWLSTCMWLDGIHRVINYWFWPAGLLPMPAVPGHAFKALCLYFNCKLFNPETWSDMGGEAMGIGFNRLGKLGYESGMGFYGLGGAKAYGYTQEKNPEHFDNGKFIPNKQIYVESTIKSVKSDDKLGGTEYSKLEGGSVYVSEQKVIAENGIEPTSSLNKQTGLSLPPPTENQLYVFNPAPSNTPKGTKGSVTIVDTSSSKNGHYQAITQKVTDNDISFGDAFKFDFKWKNSADNPFLPSGIGVISTSLPDSLYGIPTIELGTNLDEAYVDKYNEWKDMATQDLIDDIDSRWLTSDAFDPFRYEDISWFCPKAQNYNNEKRRQILCAKKLCILNSVKAGTNPMICEEAYNIHHCLYVKGALFTAQDDMFKEWWLTFLKGLLEQLIYQSIMALAYTVPCYAYYTPKVISENCVQPLETGGWLSNWCGIALVALAVFEMGSIITNWVDQAQADYENYEGSFYNEIGVKVNYCSLADGVEEEVDL